MGFVEAISSGFQKYIDFSRRSRRSEHWYWTLFTALGVIITSIVDEATTGFLLELIFALGTFSPSFAVSVRRLHDIDKSGWWLLIALVPIIGWIVLVMWAVRPGAAGRNRFGAEPMSNRRRRR